MAGSSKTRAKSPRYEALMPSSIILATASDQPDITASDQLYAEALQRRGFHVAGAPWDGPKAAFDGAAAVVIRSTWGYYRAAHSFRDWTEAMARETRLFNPIGLIRWNLRKDYVGKLAAAGVPVPDTRLVACETAAIDKVFRETGWDRAVVKPVTGASGYSVELVAREFGGCVGRTTGGRNARHGRAGAGVPAGDRRG